jgi:hypothetical protein
MAETYCKVKYRINLLNLYMNFVDGAHNRQFTNNMALEYNITKQRSGLHYFFFFLYLLTPIRMAFVGNLHSSRGLLPRVVKRPGRVAEHSLLSSADVKITGLIPSLPHTSSWRGA